MDTTNAETKIEEEGQEGEKAGNAGEQAEVLGDESMSEKEELLKLLQTLKDLGINSIEDLEVKISRL